MLVKFTNRSEGRVGDPIYINVNNIISVYESATDDGSLSTIVYGITEKFWIVEEGLSDAIVKINEAFKRNGG